MRYLMFMLFFITTATLACMPSLPSGAALKSFPTPIFKSLRGVEASVGQVKAIVSISEKGKITAIKSLELFPTSLPKDPVLKSLRAARFLMLNELAVIDEEISIPFDIEIQETLKIETPKVVIEGI